MHTHTLLLAEAIQQQQSIRAAYDALAAGLQNADLNPDPQLRYNFASQVSSIREAAKVDDFIVKVLDSVPATALGDGIQSEAGLKERFKGVRRVCRKVATVPAVGGGLETYAGSFVRSLFTLNSRPRYTVDSKADPSSMNTFDVLSQAEAHLHRGDLEMAVKYMNLLEGEARRVAADWLRDARDYLEMRQVVSLVAHHLASSSVAMLGTTGNGSLSSSEN